MEYGGGQNKYLLFTDMIFVVVSFDKIMSGLNLDNYSGESKNSKC